MLQFEKIVAAWSIMSSVDNGKVRALVLLDKFAVFDSVHHSLILHRFQLWFKFSGLAWNWFANHLS